MAINLSNDLLNSNKIFFHIGKILEDIYKGKRDFYPVAVEVHPTAVCNHRCIHCSYKERNESRVSYSEDTMEKLVDSIINMKIKAVYFSGGGEPTLYPDLVRYIKKMNAHGIEVSIITNGSYFENAGLISVANMLNYIAVSVPGIDMETFQLITGSNKLEEVLSLPKKIKKEHGINSPIIGARIVLTNKNYMYVEQFLKVMQEREYDYALFKIVRDYEDKGQGLTEEEEAQLKEEIKQLKDVDDNYTNIKYIFNFKQLPKFQKKCWVNDLGLLANISTDGGVYPNIVEIDKPEFCIGNINENSLEEIWNSERHKEVKKMSNQKWCSGECKNCRAMSYNSVINSFFDELPSTWDNFI